MTALYRNPRSGGMIFSQGGGGGGEDSLFPVLKHDTGLSVEWSSEEQYRLEEGLAKYANEPTIMKYVKIAASLCDKTVRDVALRCKWMAGKRRKHDDHQNCWWKKDKDKKELSLVGSSMENDGISPAASFNNPMLSGGFDAAIDGPTKRLLQENSQAFGQISSNLAALKLQQNIDLFFRAKQNLSKILNE
ncbi:hypothetical protein M569_14768 [Genlisea aurea]|uniref:Myb-like domain-containing protein n=1 Tax=Genlisea aurea TaxID=192259 RepID=S8C6I6_9LAMI|nr:hypothetical protein M569_14768 [Genlisea aurea]